MIDGSVNIQIWNITCNWSRETGLGGCIIPAAAAIGAEAELPPGTVGAETALPGEDMLTLIDMRSSSSSDGMERRINEHL